MTEYDFFTPKGWQCPVCGRVYSPSFPWCVVCGNEEQTVTTTTDTLVTNTGSYQPPEPMTWPNESWYMDIVNKAMYGTNKQEK